MLLISQSFTDIMCLLKVSHAAIKFTLYDQLKAATLQWKRLQGQQCNERLNSMDATVIGGLSKGVASISTYPLQVSSLLWQTMCSLCPTLQLRRNGIHRHDVLSFSILVNMPSLHSSSGCLHGVLKHLWWDRQQLNGFLQVVRSRLQQRFNVGRTLQYRSSLGALAIIIRGEGWRGLYKGIMPNLLRVMPQSSLMFVVYEGTLHGLELLWYFHSIGIHYDRGMNDFLIVWVIISES